ncbi:MAG: chromosome partitioning protein ParA, partial [Porphyromonadaceae bacterium]|nr:chromosome partitioning protein ParA [Porphyromonadaceae bacterium]
MASPNTNNNEQGEVEINIGSLLSLCLAKWRWFVLSLFVVLVLAVVYLLRTPPVYTRFVDLLIKEDSKGKSATGNLSSMFSELGFSGTDANVYNELATLRSPAIVEAMVKRLHLETEYLTPGLFRKEVAYGVERPVSVEFIDLTDEEAVSFILQMGEDGVATLSQFTYLGDEIPGEITLSDGLPDTLSTPIGRLAFLPTPYY